MVPNSVAPVSGSWPVWAIRLRASSVRTTPSTATPRTAATRALQLLGPDHVYARVDVVVDPALGALIMEVEMVEPDLFLRLSDRAADQLADAVLDRLTPAVP